MYTMKYYSALKKKENLPFAAAWLKLKEIMLSEINQKDNEKYCMGSHIWNLKKKKKKSQTHRIDSRMVVANDQEGGKQGEAGKSTYFHL